MKLMIPIPYKCLGSFIWEFIREEEGSCWKLTTETRKWLEERKMCWRLQDSYFFRNNMELQDTCVTMYDVYVATKPHIVLEDEANALLFRLQMS